MERLSGLDASFLYLETPEQLMHVCAVFVLDPSTIPGGYDFAKFRDALEVAIADIPQFTRKVQKVPMEIAHPVWVHDRHFDINRHVHRVALPGDGGFAELAQLCDHLASLPVNRKHPLWELWVIEGYRDVGRGPEETRVAAEDAADKIVVLIKMHHATVDGASGASIVSHLCSLDPDSVPVSVLTGEGRTSTGDEREQGSLEIFGRGVAAALLRPLSLGRVVQPTVDLVVQTVDRIRRGTAMAPPFKAPRTPFNGNITGQRAIGLADMLLDDFKEIRRISGATVNDVVLSVAGGALRSYLSDHDELPDAPLLATVPVSVREETQRAEGMNKVSALFARLGTDIADPWERLTSMAEANRNAKDHQKAIPADALQDWAEFAPPRTFGLAMRTYAALRISERGPVVHNLVISNVPGPPMPLYFMGAKIDALYPLGPIFHGAGLNITVLSNNGVVHVGAIACPEAVPDPERLVDYFPRELARLKAAAEAHL
ncbi:wax ester/triacylglycerol synthase family O-acyltransferase [Gordonia sp. X0973]|uniref:WS/DGAT/MGAT family O-acyltransferase n=1 Tax=Gordonia sp. X0973 TaxID=2742602 RepID=UPI000F536DCF|nr:wax ester/triacylglycerol synthase family O-acyltransferase [Gordonia sp. X0973]QKT07343.1 wax ester/triacylglycerol synthase family O-acyltransferase [Gordonia sp. X0973]